MFSDINYIIRLKRYLIHIISFFVVFIPLAKSQDIHQTLIYANEQSESGSIDEAIGLYHRVLFFDSLHIYSFEACKNLVSCYIFKNDYVKAREYSKIAGNYATNDSLRNEMIFQTAYLYLLENDYNYALIELFGINEDGSDYFSRKKDFYLGTAYFQQTDFKKSFDYFVACIDSTDKQNRDALDENFAEIFHIQKRYNPKTARTLSMIFPGTGQIYSGDLRGALNSLLLTTGLAFLYINTAINYSFIDATVSVLPWFQRYYQGGFENAGKATVIKKERKIKEHYQQILSVIKQTKL